MTDSTQVIDSTIICTIITAIGTIISGLIAWFVSRSSTKAEIEKIKESWKREDIVSSEKEFAEMAETVGRYLQNSSNKILADASGMVNAVRAKENGELAESLDELHQSLISETIYGPDIKKIGKCLDEVVKKKREAQCHKEPEAYRHPKLHRLFCRLHVTKICIF